MTMYGIYHTMGDCWGSVLARDERSALAAWLALWGDALAGCPVEHLHAEEL